MKTTETGTNKNIQGYEEGHIKTSLLIQLKNKCWNGDTLSNNPSASVGNLYKHSWSVRTQRLQNSIISCLSMWLTTRAGLTV